ncbi:MAG: helix-turn-helix transcriptional regulator [Deltaproteobacteria bacterium]|nr:helix-turn-helix transcriptional regulator [Deltaproteobacteria bacterium]
MSLAYKLSASKEARIWAASYDPKRNAFRVAMEDGQIFLLKRPIPEDDHSEVLDVYIEGDGEIFTVVQASGNEFSVPWDVIQTLSSGKTMTSDPEVGKRIGQRVKALRKERGLTQDQLAKMAGFKRPNISRLEAGIHVPGLPLLERLAESLQVKISDLISAGTL